MGDKIWDCNKGEYIATPKEVNNFFEEIESICKKYNLSISHQDGHGNFIIEDYCEGNIEWLSCASLNK